MTTFTTAPYRIQLTRAKTDGSQSKDTDDDGAEAWSEENRGNVVLFIAVIVILFIVIRFIVMRFIVFNRSRKPSNSDNSYSSKSSHSSGGTACNWETTTFDPSRYIARKGFRYSSGVVSSKDIDTIEGDHDLTFEEKEDVKRELENRARNFMAPM